MSANEIAERLAASCWVQCGSTGGEGLADYDPAQLRFRSYVGFENRIITTVDGATVPCIVLLLDRVLSRTECAVFCNRHGTVGPNESVTDRETYPVYTAPAATYAGVFCQPILRAWLGDDLSSPTFMPFGLSPGPVDVPDDLSLDQFDAIAVLLPVEDGVAMVGDFSVLVLKHPKLEGETTVEQVLPVS